MEPLRIGLLSAGARVGGNTQKVARVLAARLAAVPGVAVDVFDREHPELPIFSERLFLRPDQAALYEPLAARLAACEAFVFLSPEYNGGYAPAFKTFIDSVHPKLFAGKAIGVATVSAGPAGGARAASQILQIALAVLGYPCPRLLMVPTVDSKFDADGNLIDADFEKKMKDFLDPFLWLADAVAVKRRAAL
ncbi:MAG: NADPH-dependent FMN reductase [Elusimicrobiota bacterium]